MRKGQIKNIPSLTSTRRELRERSTPAEIMLWETLRSSRFHGRKFRRQHSIERYIADFYCASERLIIELDGEYHADPLQASNDEERDRRFGELGYKVLRFTNQRVFNDLPTVLEEIRRCFA